MLGKSVVKKLVAVSFLGAVFAACLLPQASVFADSGNGCVPTIILGGEDHEVCDTNGDSIYALLKLVLDIMTVGVGGLAIGGTIVAGIQYTTAGGSEEQVRKAKRRIFEIIVGLAIYATFYIIMQWVNKDFEVRDGSLGVSTATLAYLEQTT